MRRIDAVVIRTTCGFGLHETLSSLKNNLNIEINLMNPSAGFRLPRSQVLFGVFEIFPHLFDKTFESEYRTKSDWLSINIRIN